MAKIQSVEPNIADLANGFWYLYKRTFLPLFLNGTVTGALHKILSVHSSGDGQNAFFFQFGI